MSRQDLLPRETAVTSAEASVQSARSVIARADKNRSNAEIRSPIDGIVINRSIEPGQTVAASFSTPSLFTLARDLGKMQIFALVDESDIGQIRDDMAVRFTVAAYRDKTFNGMVREIRLQPQTVQNVVSYTVVADAENPEGVLLPGMTATVDFILSKIDDALLVPSAALRIKPTEEMQEAAKKYFEAQRAERGDRVATELSVATVANAGSGANAATVGNGAIAANGRRAGSAGRRRRTSARRPLGRRPGAGHGAAVDRRRPGRRAAADGQGRRLRRQPHPGHPAARGRAPGRHPGAHRDRRPGRGANQQQGGRNRGFRPMGLRDGRAAPGGPGKAAAPACR